LTMASEIPKAAAITSNMSSLIASFTYVQAIAADENRNIFSARMYLWSREALGQNESNCSKEGRCKQVEHPSYVKHDHRDGNGHCKLGPAPSEASVSIHLAIDTNVHRLTTREALNTRQAKAISPERPRRRDLDCGAALERMTWPPSTRRHLAA
jgi:hypothetical protein